MDDDFLRDIRQWLLRGLLRADTRGASEHVLEPEDLWIPMPRTPLD